MSDDLDVRVRRALAARAGQITAERLRPAELPGKAEPAGPRRLARWDVVRRWLAPGLVGAAAMAVLFAVLVIRQPDRPPAQPAGPPASSTPAAPSPVAPSPSAVVDGPQPAPTDVRKPGPLPTPGGGAPESSPGADRAEPSPGAKEAEPGRRNDNVAPSPAGTRPRPTS
ncbi:hypothetical protein [Actinoplanes sp. NBRC 103695]|uniref:hypothetical protein n=1 Tax=Actinoplanes sp. NBRC 103695 TaxID=3032202 RepID=UPI0024A024CB|nr:hypothetical protein [Actinoplanes sp. NBRC 103695]GLY93594.1 hypothetical protein Acsp02_08500 [Actinoplanes sp. NBRC 103695]